MRTKWLTFHDRKWLNLKRPLTTEGLAILPVAKSNTRIEQDNSDDSCLHISSHMEIENNIDWVYYFQREII